MSAPQCTGAAGHAYDALGACEARDCPVHAKARHTPGPWQIRARSPHKDHPVCIVEAGTWDVICEMSGSAPTDNAHAALIAAAPELLETLHNVMSCAEVELLKYSGLWAQVRDVIAKAEGRTP